MLYVEKKAATRPQKFRIAPPLASMYGNDNHLKYIFDEVSFHGLYCHSICNVTVHMYSKKHRYVIDKSNYVAKLLEKFM